MNLWITLQRMNIIIMHGGEIMRFDFNPTAIVYTDSTDIYDVYFLIIDKDDKTIELNDQSGFSIGLIHYENCEECGYMPHSTDLKLNGENFPLVKNGELIFEGGE